MLNNLTSVIEQALPLKLMIQLHVCASWYFFLQGSMQEVPLKVYVGEDVD